MLTYTEQLLPKLFPQTATKRGNDRVSQAEEGSVPGRLAEENDVRSWGEQAVWWLVKKLRPTWQKEGQERFRLLFSESHSVTDVILATLRVKRGCVCSHRFPNTEGPQHLPTGARASAFTACSETALLFTQLCTGGANPAPCTHVHTCTLTHAHSHTKFHCVRDPQVFIC